MATKLNLSLTRLSWEDFSEKLHCGGISDPSGSVACLLANKEKE